MKFSKSSTISSFFTLIVLLAVLLAPGAKAKAVFTDVNQLGFDLETLKTKLGQIQKLSGQVPGLQGSQGQIAETLANLEGLSTGVGTLGRVLDIPVINQIPGVQTQNGINAGIEGFSAILNTPLFSNFEGAGKVQQTLSKAGNIANGLVRIGNFLDIPEIKNLDSLLNAAQGKGGPIVGGGFAGGGGTFAPSNPLQAGVQLAQGLATLNQETKSTDIVSAGISAFGGLVGEEVEEIFGFADKVPTESSGIDVAAACAVSQGAGGGVADQVVAGVVGNAQDIVGGAVKTQATSFISNAFSGVTGGISNFVGSLFGGATGGVIDQIGSIGKGVPVVEQDGPLLKVVQESRNLSQIACQHLAMIRYIQEYLNPEAQKAAKEALTEAEGRWKTNEASGRNSLIKGAPGQTFFPDRESYVAENTRIARAVAIAKVGATLEDSGNKYASEILRQIKQDGAIADDPNQQIVAALQPVTEKQWEKPGDQLLNAIDPRNNRYVQYRAAQNAVAQEVARAEENSGKTWDASGGTAPQIECPEGSSYIKTDIGEVCEKPRIALTGKVIGDISSAYNTSPIRQGELADSPDKNITSQQSLQRQEAAIINSSTASEGRIYTVSDVFGVVDIVCDINPNLELCKQAGGAANILGTLSEITGTDLFGQGIASAGPPSVDITVGPIAQSASGPDTNTLSWRAANVSQCVATTDWISYSDNANVTLTPSIIVPRGTALSPGGSQTIGRPALFKVIATSDGSSQQAGVRTSLTNTHQESLFTPNMTSVTERSRFEITIGNSSIATRVPLSAPTQQAVVSDLKSAKVNIPAGDRRLDEFNKYSFSGENALLISRPLPIPVQKLADYGISCTGPGGEVTDSLKLSF